MSLVIVIAALVQVIIFSTSMSIQNKALMILLDRLSLISLCFGLLGFLVQHTVNQIFVYLNKKAKLLSGDQNGV